MDNKNSAIITTLIYADIFDYPLNNQELYKYQMTAPEPASPAGGAVTLKPESADGFYYLPGRHSIVALRKKRESISKTKLAKAQKISKQLSKIPTILGVFVTGNLAMLNADDHDDVDFLIITKGNTLWTTRLWVTLLLELMGVRRRPQQKKTSNRICVNMYLDESALNVPLKQRNLYTAHEVIQVLPLINNQHIYERFLSANSWANVYLPNFPIKLINQPPIRKYKPSLIEKLAFVCQRWYMKGKMTREVITPHSALFHPRDTGSYVLKIYESKVN